ncbi:MAG: hypothetical protein NZL92_09775 [Gloeomargarita sp. SKYG116]|nr:hypothetical protein [Gloeomargarita sp. SKYG116]MCS7226749.1 hypothetical protein [Gloeomargarita sp. SKYB31]MDW8401970.1 hypothetical protein [Gloeomargarita sp. SKYGB_i_bin116]
MTQPGYGGYQMRSFLEARWAAFFDLLGWQWEYEPADFGGYIPDFVLLGPAPLLVEVKAELSLAGLKRHQEKIDRYVPPEYEVLLVGVTPILWVQGFPVAGLLRGPTWGYAPWGGRPPAVAYGIHHWNCWYGLRPSGAYKGTEYAFLPSDYVAALRVAWVQAHNRTQWQKESA